MNKTLKIIGGIAAGLIIIFLIWRFSNIVFYVLIATVLSIIGRTLVNRLNSVRIGKFHIPNGISALIALLVIILVILSFAGIFVPLIARQANVISNIDFTFLSDSVQESLKNLEEILIKYQILDKNETLRQIISDQINSILNMTTFSNTISSIIGFTGSFFIAAFSIIFLTFFFMKDSYLIDEMINVLTPVKYQNEVRHILHQTKRLLSRYFIGLCIELTSMMTLIAIGLTIFGVRNSILIGFFGGLMNVIPYLGPIIGAAIGILLAVSTQLSLGLYTEILPLVLIVIGVFSCANIIDNIVLQPLIYSSSVKAHPVEIFLVILIGGSLAGIPGMILAIPSYTVIRIVAKEFLSQFQLVQKLTKNI